jgi:predicted TPR repeat methyltransferase
MNYSLEDTKWGSVYGSCAAVQAAFDRFGPEYHEAILASGVPAGAARALMPLLTPDARGIDLGCGSGVLGLALREQGLQTPLDGVDLSPGMLELARRTGAYGDLVQANLLVPEERPPLHTPYDFAITVGLIGDYIPYYVGLPLLVAAVHPGSPVGFAVETTSTPYHPLMKLAAELGLEIVSETVLPVPQAKLEQQVYHFYACRLR